MIDIIKAKQAFKEYVKKYNPEDKKIKLKIAHIERTAEVAKNTAKSLNLSKEDVDLAKLIGLLHDIGRFEQVRIYNTFMDRNSVNHGELGVKILFEDGLIRNFIQDKSYDNIIKFAILNHNRGKIQDGLTNRELLHAKIIRDSDKLDIFKVLLTEDVETCWETKDMTKEIITPEIYREFMEDKSINYKNRRSAADTLVCHFAYVFDFNFKYGLDIINKEGYLKLLYNRFEFEDNKTKNMIKNIFIEASRYVNTKTFGDEIV